MPEAMTNESRWTEPTPDVPEFLPAVSGFWGINGSWTSWEVRRDWLLSHSTTDRRRRLVAVLFAGRVLPLVGLRDRPQCRRAVVAAEQYADGSISFGELRKAHDAAAAYAAAAADAYAADAYADEWRRQTRLLTLALPVPGWSPRWQTGAAVGLAERMYAAADFDAMPILADAIEDAGCELPDLLLWMRSLPPHCWYRGCWIIDELTGRK